jgi:5,10-methylenetetrahydromethanopterin reductase
MNRSPGSSAAPLFSLALPLDAPVDVIGERAHTAEQLGFDRVWIPDERLRRSVYVALAACALKTESLGLGVGVTNPYTRHAAVTAANIATVDELRPGRVILGLGAGGELSHVGLTPQRPRTAVRETIETVRRLTGAGSGGDDWTTSVGRLEFGNGPIPIYVASRGPRMLELAGAMADGVMIGGYATPPGFRWALRHVEAGIAGSGRRTGDVRRLAWLYTSLDADPEQARAAVRPIVLASMMTSRDVLPDIGVELPKRLRVELDSRAWKLSRQELVELSGQLDETLVTAFSLAGDAAQCAERLATLVADEGIDEVGFVCFPPAGTSVVELAERIMSDLVPAVLTASHTGRRAS